MFSDSMVVRWSETESKQIMSHCINDMDSTKLVAVQINSWIQNVNEHFMHLFKLLIQHYHISTESWNISCENCRITLDIQKCRGSKWLSSYESLLTRSHRVNAWNVREAQLCECTESSCSHGWYPFRIEKCLWV